MYVITGDFTNKYFNYADPTNISGNLPYVQSMSCTRIGKDVRQTKHMNNVSIAVQLRPCFPYVYLRTSYVA
jgi:hypothetical protein